MADDRARRPSPCPLQRAQSCADADTPPTSTAARFHSRTCASPSDAPSKHADGDADHRRPCGMPVRRERAACGDGLSRIPCAFSSHVATPCLCHRLQRSTHTRLMSPAGVAPLGGRGEKPPPAGRTEHTGGGQERGMQQPSPSIAPARTFCALGLAAGRKLHLQQHRTNSAALVCACSLRASPTKQSSRCITRLSDCACPAGKCCGRCC